MELDAVLPAGLRPGEQAGVPFDEGLGFRRDVEVVVEAGDVGDVRRRQAPDGGDQELRARAVVDRLEPGAGQDRAQALGVLEAARSAGLRAERWHDLGSMYERQLDLGIGDPVLVRFQLAELSRAKRGDTEREKTGVFLGRYAVRGDAPVTLTFRMAAQTAAVYARLSQAGE